MTKSTITREQLLNIIETDHVQCGEAAYLACMALAAMDSEPVAVPDHLTYLQNPTLENVLSDAEENSPMSHAARILAKEVKFWRSVPLYRHAQPAPVVPVNDVTNGKPLTINLPDTSSKAFWSGSGKAEVFHPETYKRWVKEAIERYCAIARIDVEVK